MSTASAPVEIASVTLTVHDLPKVAAFYEHLLGLHRLSSDGATVRLGLGNEVLIELRGDKAARQSAPREAGLFHTAFLMPSRAALGSWLIHSSENRIPLHGASDHLVSEAIYLADPEGNGIEVYADRPRVAWYNPDGSIKMATEGLDLNDVARSAKTPFSGAPEGLTIGHVHLLTQQSVGLRPRQPGRPARRSKPFAIGYCVEVQSQRFLIASTNLSPLAWTRA